MLILGHEAPVGSRSATGGLSIVHGQPVTSCGGGGRSARRQSDLNIVSDIFRESGLTLKEENAPDSCTMRIYSPTIVNESIHIQEVLRAKSQMRLDYLCCPARTRAGLVLGS
jgi:hypothetical protein